MRAEALLTPDPQLSTLREENGLIINLILKLTSRKLRRGLRRTPKKMETAPETVTSEK